MKSIDSSTSSFKASEHQAAGHDGCMTSESLFIKPTTKQELDFYTETVRRDGIKEDNTGEDGVALGSLLSHWMPTFLGSLQKGQLDKSVSVEDSLTSQDKEYIVLQNLYHGFKNPSILDIKLGSKLTDDSVTPPEKIKRLQKVSDSTTSGSHSFRICGMKVYNGNTDNKPKEIFPGMSKTITTVESEHSLDDTGKHYLVYDKIFGRSLDSSTIQQGLELYFHSISSNKLHFICLITNFIHRLQLLYNCLLDYETRSFSASLLFIFESDPSKWENVSVEDFVDYDPLIKEFELSDDDEEEDDNPSDGTAAIEKEGLDKVSKAYNIVKHTQLDDLNHESGERETLGTPLSSLHLIDFAHSKYVDGEGYDENVIEGVENLIKIFQDIKQSYTK
ncbi:hypothetical protein I9W82_002996 [Candida metapsilosis]|uniref:Kinase n=1 Tax=Candida metapsilosis TaxID=273372 RepID=A0A8H7ZET9_9ASCO|nr:hypothetical protein I9W82_002996 [Candida metapsilosis]